MTHKRQILKSIVLVYILVIFFSCSNKYRKIKKHHIENNIISKLDSKSSIMQIYIIRHAKVDINKPFWSNTKCAQQYLNHYNTASIKEFNQGNFCININPEQEIFCSNLSRSISTSRKLFPHNSNITQSALYRELELSIPVKNKSIKLPTFLRQAYHRLSYLLGRKYDNIENFSIAKKRISSASEQLVLKAQHDSLAILVSHGFFNRLLIHNLKNKSWHIIKNKSQKNLGITLLVKERRE